MFRVYPSARLPNGLLRTVHEFLRVLKASVKESFSVFCKARGLWLRIFGSSVLGFGVLVGGRTASSLELGLFFVGLKVLREAFRHPCAVLV